MRPFAPGPRRHDRGDQGRCRRLRQPDGPERMNHLIPPAEWDGAAAVRVAAGAGPDGRAGWADRLHSVPAGRLAADKSSLIPAAWLYLDHRVQHPARGPSHPESALGRTQPRVTTAGRGDRGVRGAWRSAAAAVRPQPLGHARAAATVATTLWRFTHAPGLAMCLLLAVEGAGMILGHPQRLPPPR